MMKRICTLMMAGVLLALGASGQGIHYSQYYNTPLQLNPANTGLLPDYDYRVGLNYRGQWGSVPVPYRTFSAWGDAKVGGKKDDGLHNNWLGIGFAFYNDKAGDGELSLSQIQGDIAYHIQLNSHLMLSLGMSAAAAQRSVDYDKLSFDEQWDGENFNSHIPNGERPGVLKTGYYTVGSGLNLAWFPSDNVYVKLGGSVANLNKPVETFYNNNKNVLDYRPYANLDVLIKAGPVLILNPSAYYTQMKGAMELVCGTQVRTVLSSSGETPTQLILGGYMRLGDALIGVAGMQLGAIQFMANYDFTTSQLSPYNASFGALEFSLIYQGRYYGSDRNKKAYSCPRFF